MEFEEQTIVRYLCGLRYEISNIVQLQPYLSLNDVCKLSLKVERQLGEAKARTRKTYESGGSLKPASQNKVVLKE